MSADDSGFLADRMETAATWLEEATERYHIAGKSETGGLGQRIENIEWSPANLRYVARQFREEDDEQSRIREGIVSLIRNMHLAPTHTVAQSIMNTFDVRRRDLVEEFAQACRDNPSTNP